MKEFDLDKAKVGVPVCTRAGLKARIVCFNVKSEEENHNILALVENDRGYEMPVFYGDDGKFYVPNSPCPPTYYSDCDLMMATVKHEGWVIIHPVGPQCIAHIYDTKEEAEEDAEREMINYSAIAHIEWEE